MLLYPWPQPGNSPLLDGLVAYYALFDTTDNIGGNHLTNNNGVAFTTSGKTGGKAATFVRATQQALTISDNAALSMGDIDFTLAYWVRLASKPSSGEGNMAVLSKWNYSATNREYFSGYQIAPDRFNFSVTPNGSAQTHLYADSHGSPALNTWYLVVCWHDSAANTINIQINNGTVDSLFYATGVFNGNSMFSIGGMLESNDLWFDGDVDEVAIWKRTLSTLERTTLWNQGNGVTWPLPGITS